MLFLAISGRGIACYRACISVRNARLFQGSGWPALILSTRGKMALRLAQERTDIGSVNAMPAVDFTLFDRVGLPRSLAQVRIDCLSWLSGPALRSHQPIASCLGPCQRVCSLTALSVLPEPPACYLSWAERLERMRGRPVPRKVRRR